MTYPTCIHIPYMNVTQAPMAMIRGGRLLSSEEIFPMQYSRAAPPSRLEGIRKPGSGELRIREKLASLISFVRAYRPFMLAPKALPKKHQR
jgi:hypothetical protein